MCNYSFSLKSSLSLKVNPNTYVSSVAEIVKYTKSIWLRFDCEKTKKVNISPLENNQFLRRIRLSYSLCPISFSQWGVRSKSRDSLGFYYQCINALVLSIPNQADFYPSLYESKTYLE